MDIKTAYVLLTIIACVFCFIPLIIKDFPKIITFLVCLITVIVGVLIGAKIAWLWGITALLWLLMTINDRKNKKNMY